METDSTTLKTYFETGDKPTQLQFENFIDSYENLVDNNLLTGKDASITDITPASQNTAYEITKKFNRISVAHNTTGGVKLPNGFPNCEILIYNNGGYISNIYPAVGEQILGYSVNSPLQINDGDTIYFRCIKTGVWQAFYANLKTINSTSILGSGNINISANLTAFAYIKAKDGVNTTSLGGVGVPTKVNLNGATVTQSSSVGWSTNADGTITNSTGGARFCLITLNIGASKATTAQRDDFKIYIYVNGSEQAQTRWYINDDFTNSATCQVLVSVPNGANIEAYIANMELSGGNNNPTVRTMQFNVLPLN